MAELGQATVIFGADVKSLKSGIQSALALARKFGKGIQDVGKKIQGIGVKAGLIGAAISAPFLLGVKAVVSFDSALREVGTLLDKTPQELDGLKSSLEELSVTFGTDLIDNTRAAYQAISAGVPQDNVFEFLKVASKAAIAGVSNTETAVDVLTTVVNSFASTFDESLNTFERANIVSDVLFQTVKDGKTTFEELAQNIGNVASTAAAGGVTMQELGAAYAALTSGGIATAEATTAINQTILSLIKTTDDAAAAFDAANVNVAGFRDGSVSFAEVMDQVAKATGGSTEALTEMFPNIRALKGALVLAGTGADKFKDSLKNQAGAAGVAGDAFNIMADGLQTKFNIAVEKSKAILRNMGEAVMPLVLRGLDSMGKAMDVASTFIKNNEQLFSALALTVAALGAGLITLGAILIPLGATIAAVGTIFAALLTPVGAIAALITVTLAAAILIFKDDLIALAKKAKEVWPEIKERVKAFVTDALPLLLAVKENIKSLGGQFDSVKTTIIKALKAIGGVFDATFDNVVAFVDGFFSEMRRLGVTDSILGKASDSFDDFKDSVDGAKDSVTTAVDFIKEVISKAFDKIKEVGNGIRNFFSGLEAIIRSKLERFRDVGTAVAGTLVTAFLTLKSLFTTLKPVIVNAIEIIKGALSTFFDIVTTVWRVQLTVLQAKFMLVKGALEALAPALRILGDVIKNVFFFIKSIVDGVVGFIIERFDNLKALLFSVVDVVVEVFGVIGKIIETVFTLAGAIISGFTKTVSTSFGEMQGETDKSSGKFIDRVKDIVQSVSNFVANVSELIGFITSFINDHYEEIQRAGKVLGEKFIELFKMVKKAVDSVVLIFRIFGAVVNALVGIVNIAFDAITDRIRKFFDMAKKAFTGIKEFMNLLNPFSKSSPSLVENVTTGVDAMLKQWQRMEDQVKPIMERTRKDIGLVAQAAREVAEQLEKVKFAVQFVRPGELPNVPGGSTGSLFQDSVLIGANKQLGDFKERNQGLIDALGGPAGLARLMTQIVRDQSGGIDFARTNVPEIELEDGTKFSKAKILGIIRELERLEFKFLQGFGATNEALNDVLRDPTQLDALTNVIGQLLNLNNRGRIEQGDNFRGLFDPDSAGSDSLINDAQQDFLADLFNRAFAPTAGSDPALIADAQAGFLGAAAAASNDVTVIIQDVHIRTDEDIRILVEQVIEAVHREERRG